MIRKIFLSIVLVLFFVYANVVTSTFAYAEDNLEVDDNILRAEQAYKAGVSLTQSRAYDSALKSFNDAVLYNPQMVDAYYNIASIYVSQKKFDEAYNAYLKVIALKPSDYDSILQVAKISYNRKNYSLALKYLKYIPDDYAYYNVVTQMKKDATELFNLQKNKIERSKISTATETKRVLIDNLSSPAGLVVDSEGNMFVASYSDNAIVKIDSDKNKSNFVKDYLIEGPVGLAIDKYDNIYVANYDANNILKVTKGGKITVFMDKVAQPYFLYIKDDILYISEQGHDVVLTYNLSNSN